jgi:hypothetical protein
MNPGLVNFLGVAKRSLSDRRKQLRNYDFRALLTGCHLKPAPNANLFSR